MLLAALLLYKPESRNGHLCARVMFSLYPTHPAFSHIPRPVDDATRHTRRKHKKAHTAVTHKNSGRICGSVTGVLLLLQRREARRFPLWSSFRICSRSPFTQISESSCVSPGIFMSMPLLYFSLHLLSPMYRRTARSQSTRRGNHRLVRECGTTKCIHIKWLHRTPS